MQSAFAQNGGLVAITGIQSHFVMTASGIRTLSKIDYYEQKNLIIIVTSIAVGMVPMIDHSFYADFPKRVQTLFHSGVSSTCLMAIILNLLFNHLNVFKRKT